MYDIYDEIYLEGYYDALDEAYDVKKKMKKAEGKAALGFAGVGAAGAGAAVGGSALAIRQGMKIHGYLGRLNELKAKKKEEGLTPEEKKEYKKLLLKTAGRGAIGAGAVGLANKGVKFAAAGTAGAAAVNHASRKFNKAVFKESFSQGYVDALMEMYDYDDYYDYY